MSLGGPRVLVVEDDRKTAEVIRAYLEKDGYRVATAHDGESGLQAALDDLPDLVVLELRLPVIGGMDMCHALRAESSVPIIVLTALTIEQQKLNGLALGADDFVTKPFSPRELVARVGAVLRRTADERRNPVNQSLTYKNLHLNPNSHSVSVQGREIRLTPTEFRLLEVLMREPGRLFTRSLLMETTRGYDYDGSNRTIDVHILNLRRKIESGSNRHGYIHTVYGGGYKLGR